jgi:transmembrane sensor
MSEQPGFPGQEAQSTAVDWVIRLQGAEIGESDWLAFDDWLAIHTDHGAAYDRALALWLELDGRALPAVADAQPADTVLPFGSRLKTRTISYHGSPRWVGWGAAAAAAMLAIWLALPASEPNWQNIQTRTGQHDSTVLADGSRLDLAGATQLSYAFDGKTRRVKMAEGEVLFDIAKDDRHPFIIEVGDRSVRVVGTAFDVRQRGDQLSVAVLRGEVEVAPRAGGAAMHLLPGKRFDHHLGAITSQLSEVAAEEISSWRSGRLIYRDRPLSELVDDLNSQFDRPVTLAESRLGDLRFSGVLVLDDQESVIRRLTLLTPLWSSSSAAGIMLRAKEASAP